MKYPLGPCENHVAQPSPIQPSLAKKRPAQASPLAKMAILTIPGAGESPLVLFTGENWILMETTHNHEMSDDRADPSLAAHRTPTG